MSKTIENKVAETILQEPFEVKVGDKSYHVAPASTATLIEVSKLISQLPSVKLDNDKVVQESLQIAKDCALLGDIAAVLVLGVQLPCATKKTAVTRWFDKWRNGDALTQRRALATEILHHYSASGLNNLIAELLAPMEVSSFFALTTFLLEVNLLKATR